MLYTPRMRQEVHSIKPPHDFIIDILEYTMGKPHFISVRFYESQWEYYNEKERLDCILYLSKIRKILTSSGCSVTLEPIIDTGNSLPTNKKVRGKGIV